MNYFTATDLTAGLLQLAVAGYALWLVLRYGTARAGWPLFSAFSILALLHSVLYESPLPIAIINIVYGLTAVLLLPGMVFLEVSLKQQQRAEEAAKQARAAEHLMRSELELRIQEQTEELSNANEELRRTAERLKVEMAQREWQQANAQKIHREMLEASRRAGMSEVATSVLHNVGNVLNSVNISAALVADHVAGFRVENIARAAKMMREHAMELGTFLTTDPKGKQLPEYLAKLAGFLSGEQLLIQKELGFVRQKIDHIKQIVATQQSYGRVVGLDENIRVDEVVEDVLRIQAGELSEHQVQVRREFESQLPEVMVDKHKVLQILLNLLSNAKHACLESNQQERQVTVRVTNGDDWVRVIVSDNGVGIPANNLKTIFNHGFTTRKKGGHGFGLHGSALAAKEFGGRVTAQSEGPGKGATFTLEIPLKPASGNSAI